MRTGRWSSARGLERVGKLCAGTLPRRQQSEEQARRQRDAESEHYVALGYNFEQDEDVYRAGFESALRRECRGRSVDEEADCLKWWYPDFWDSEPFRRGFERGRKRWKRLTCSAPFSALPSASADASKN